MRFRGRKRNRTILCQNVRLFVRVALVIIIYLSLPQVSSLPYPMTDSLQFKKTMAAPIGRHWNTETRFTEMIRPKFVKFCLKVYSFIYFSATGFRPPLAVWYIPWGWLMRWGSSWLTPPEKEENGFRQTKNNICDYFYLFFSNANCQLNNEHVNDFDITEDWNR